MKKMLFIILQCTWGILQTLIGAFFFLRLIRCPHTMYHGCIDTRWNRRSGMSLGLFIFTPDEEGSRAEKLRTHEYGHCIQSMVLGPLYLIIAVISLVWKNLPYFARLRREKKIPYDACFVESWASRWGEKAIREKAA